MPRLFGLLLNAVSALLKPPTPNSAFDIPFLHFPFYTSSAYSPLFSPYSLPIRVLFLVLLSSRCLILVVSLYRTGPLIYPTVLQNKPLVNRAIFTPLLPRFLLQPSYTSVHHLISSNSHFLRLLVENSLSCWSLMTLYVFVTVVINKKITITVTTK